MASSLGISASVFESFLKQCKAQSPPLPQRLEECFYLVARGKTAKEIARVLNIDYRTVEVHIERLKRKLDCHTKSQLIEKAFETGAVYQRPKSLNI